MLEIVKTADGSNTIYNTEVGENYHSRHGALQESRHVFVNSGLCYFLEGQIKVSPPAGGGNLEGANTGVSILEVGFGTGLNFLLSADLCAEKGIALDYTGIEAYPLSLGMISQTGYDQFAAGEMWDKFISNYEGLLLSQVELNPNCKLQIANCKLLDFQSEKQFDIIYFDAFASARQPEMWDEAAISHTIRFLKPGGVFVTYAITGNLKRALKALGCKVEKAPGAAGKREMLRAVKLV
jgi:tRNA U34 5-methylaminomethyl-2-thiouridine-forming methyltransferase MnmC